MKRMILSLAAIGCLAMPSAAKALQINDPTKEVSENAASGFILFQVSGPVADAGINIKSITLSDSVTTTGDSSDFISNIVINNGGLGNTCAVGAGVTSPVLAGTCWVNVDYTLPNELDPGPAPDGTNKFSLFVQLADNSSASGTATVLVDDIPEPMSLALFSTALAGLGLARHRLMKPAILK